MNEKTHIVYLILGIILYLLGFVGLYLYDKTIGILIATILFGFILILNWDLKGVI